MWIPGSNDRLFESLASNGIRKINGIGGNGHQHVWEFPIKYLEMVNDMSGLQRSMARIENYWYYRIGGSQQHGRSSSTMWVDWEMSTVLVCVRRVGHLCRGTQGGLLELGKGCHWLGVVCWLEAGSMMQEGSRLFC